MSCCPDSVPTLLWKMCESPFALIHQEGYSDDTGVVFEGFAGRSIADERPKYKVTLTLKDDLAVREFFRWHKETIANGTGLWAIFGDHAGETKWWVVRLVDNRVKFSAKSRLREAILEVYIYGYAKTVTEPSAECSVLCDDGDQMTEGGCTITADAVSGVASDLICKE